MEQVYIEEETFNKINYSQSPLAKGEYEYCKFSNCNFSESDLSGITFLECDFIDCNLSNAILKDTALRDTRFKDCKMLGLHFDDCKPFGFSVHFDNCLLNHSSFYQTKLKKVIIKDSILHEVDFVECDLSNSSLKNCDLLGALFENTIMEKTDFCTSINYSIDLDRNFIKRTRFSQDQLACLLNKYDIVIDP